MLIACASWPDRWERRKLVDGTFETRFTPHRGPTHSIVLIVLMLTLFGFLYMFVMAYMQLYHVVISLVVLRILVEIALGIVAAFVLHILADMLTRDGVKLLWPANADIGIPPIRKLRPLYASPGEYAWLWGILFAAGVLFALGVVGF
jgi:membrane-bound metal-dependent hydrolase YbcI (DUF457 family)